MPEPQGTHLQGRDDLGGLLLVTDDAWFVSQGLLEAEIEAGLVETLSLGAIYLSGAVGMEVVTDHMLPHALSRLMDLTRPATETRRTAGAAVAERPAAVGLSKRPVRSHRSPIWIPATAK